MEFDISPETDKIQMFETEDEIEPCKEQIEFLYVPQILAGMENKKEALRKCSALGGKMDVLSDESEMKDFSYDSAGCPYILWAPVFRYGDGWIDHNNRDVKYLTRKKISQSSLTYTDVFS